MYAWVIDIAVYISVLNEAPYTCINTIVATMDKLI